MSDKIKRIQVPNKYIDNKDFNNNSFYLYVILKTICVNNHVKIYKQKLLNKLRWTQYQLRKYLKDLKNENLITYTFGDLPKFEPIELDVFTIKHKSKNKEDYYTQVDVGTINNIIGCAINVKFNKKNKIIKKDVKEQALRLFYLYEMYYNEKYKCAFIGYDKIKNSMDIHNTYIKNINTVFNKNDLVKVMVGDWRDDLDNEIRRRNPNNYIPNCNRVKKKED